MNNNCSILLVEDDSIDALMVTRAFKELNISNKLVHSENGEEALHYLMKNEPPCTILLDLNMPRMGGIEFLEEAKKKDYLKSIPIIILSTSSEHQDLIDIFKPNIVEYIIKPVDYHDFVKTIKVLSKYWTQRKHAQ